MYNLCEHRYDADRLRREVADVYIVHSKYPFFDGLERLIRTTYWRALGRFPEKKREQPEWYEALRNVSSANEAEATLLRALCASPAYLKQVQAGKPSEGCTKACIAFADLRRRCRTACRPATERLAWAEALPLHRPVVWSADLHTGPIACSEPVLAELGARLHAEVDFHNCRYHAHMCKSRLRILAYDEWRGFGLEPCPNLMRRAFFEAYKRDEELRRVDLFVCSHPAANCELFLPFDRAILVHATTRLEFGRNDPAVAWRVPFIGKLTPGRWRDWIANLRAIASKPGNVVAANNLFDLHYIRYHADVPVVFLPSWCGHDDGTQQYWSPQRLDAPHSSTSRARGDNTTAGWSFPFLLGPYRDNLGGGVVHGTDAQAWAHPVLQGLVRASDGTGLVFKRMGELYARYTWGQLLRHPAMVFIPYQVSVISFFEYYRARLPMFVPSVTLLASWVREHGLMWERVYGEPQRLQLGAVDEPDSPNDARNLTYWLSQCDYYQMPHVVTFDSWEELVATLRRPELPELLTNVSRAMGEFSAGQKQQIKATWREILRGAVARRRSGRRGGAGRRADEGDEGDEVGEGNEGGEGGDESVGALAGAVPELGGEDMAQADLAPSDDFDEAIRMVHGIDEALPDDPAWKCSGDKPDDLLKDAQKGALPEWSRLVENPKSMPFMLPQRFLSYARLRSTNHAHEMRVDGARLCVVAPRFNNTEKPRRHLLNSNDMKLCLHEGARPAKKDEKAARIVWCHATCPNCVLSLNDSGALFLHNGSHAEVLIAGPEVAGDAACWRPSPKEAMADELRALAVAEEQLQTQKGASHATHGTKATVVGRKDDHAATTATQPQTQTQGKSGATSEEDEATETARLVAELKALRNQRILRPLPIVVRSHNAKSDNADLNDLIDSLLRPCTYDFACLQEFTTDMVAQLQSAIPATHTILTGLVCESSTMRAVMVYNSTRFDQIGEPYYGCFRLKDDSLDSGRPFVAAAFHDRWVGLRLIVASILAPQSGYSLQTNLKYMAMQALQLSGVSWGDISHVIIAGDFNRIDWSKSRSFDHPMRTEPFHSAQGSAFGMIGTITINGTERPQDNVLYASRLDPGRLTPLHSVELTAFKRGDKHGSDHHPITAVFAANDRSASTVTKL